jgi:hypothetical protein
LIIKNKYTFMKGILINITHNLKILHYKLNYRSNLVHNILWINKINKIIWRGNTTFWELYKVMS